MHIRSFQISAKWRWSQTHEWMDAPKAGGILLWEHPGPKNVWRFFPRHSVECVEVVAICPNLAASPRKLAKVVSTTPLLNRWEYAQHLRMPCLQFRIWKCFRAPFFRLCCVREGVSKPFSAELIIFSTKHQYLCQEEEIFFFDFLQPLHFNQTSVSVFEIQSQRLRSTHAAHKSVTKQPRGAM